MGLVHEKKSNAAAVAMVMDDDNEHDCEWWRVKGETESLGFVNILFTSLASKFHIMSYVICMGSLLQEWHRQ